MGKLPENIAAELKSIREEVGKEYQTKFAELDKQSSERWDEFVKSHDALDGNAVKSMLDDRVKLLDEKQDKIETAIQDRMDEFETKMQKRGGSGSPKAAALKAIDEFKLPENGTGRFSIPTKAVQVITRAGDYDADDGGVLDTPRPGVYAYPQAPLSLREMVLSGTISGMYFPYERELAGSQEGDANYQTEGSAKATMDIYTEDVVGQVATIAVTARCGTQVMNDREAFFSFLRARLGYRVQKKLNSEMVSGAGSAQIEGINTIATAYDDSHVGLISSAQKLDILRYAKNQVGLANYAANYILLHPTDWAAIETAKDGDYRYLIGDPRAGGSVPTGQGRVGSLWGLPVVTDVAQTLDDFTVGDGTASQLLMRQEMEVAVSTEDQDNFVKNLVTIRAELRALLVNYSATAHVTGDFSDSIAAT